MFFLMAALVLVVRYLGIIMGLSFFNAWAFFYQWSYPCRRTFFSKGLGCKFLRHFMDHMEGTERKMLRKYLRLNGKTSWSCPSSHMLLDKGLGDPFPYNPDDVLCNPHCLKWMSSPSGPISKSSKPVIHWLPLPTTTLKWNVDASLSPLEQRSSIGGVLRDHNGNFLCIFSNWSLV